MEAWDIPPSLTKKKKSVLLAIILLMYKFNKESEDTQYNQKKRYIAKSPMTGTALKCSSQLSAIKHNSQDFISIFHCKTTTVSRKVCKTIILFFINGKKL